MQDNLEELAAALNDHQVTDDQGQVTGETETPYEETAPQETDPQGEVQTTDEDFATAEKPVEPDDVTTPSDTQDSESNFAEDESGKRYVPEKRFKEVYGKLKDAERKLGSTPTPEKQQIPTTNPNTELPISRTDQIEIELLRATLPQFDPRKEDTYDENLNEVADQYFRANPGITRIQAANMAIETAKKLAIKEVGIQTEARKVKSLQADQGITSRVSQRANTQPDPNTMSEKELEKYLKDTGQW